MKNQIYRSSRYQARPANARSIFCRRSRAWPGLLLAGCCAVLTGLPHPARAAVTEAWVHRYNNVVSNANDQAFKVVRDAAGDIIVTGNTGQDMLTIKYSGADGSVFWQQRYTNGVSRALAVDGSGNVVVTGYSYNGTSYDYYTAKYAAADGALLWEKRYNGPANSYDQATAVVVDGTGNVAVTGYSVGTNNYDYYTAKYAAADGALLWEQRYNGPASGEDYAQAVAVDGSGNVVVTGSSYNTNGNSDYYTAKYAAADGALLWEKRYNGPANSYDDDRAVVLDGSGNVVVTGYSVGSGSGYDYYTAKYAAADGALLWEKRYNGPANRDDQPQAVAVDGSGNVVVTGYSSYINGYYSDYYTAKYAAANGALLWEKRYNGPANRNDQPQAVAVDDSGNVVVTGSSASGLDSQGYPIYDYYTAKYAAANGALLWEKRGPGGGAVAVAVDGSGNVVVTGYSSYINGYYSDYYTAKYAAADGAQIWEQRYNGPSFSYDGAQAVAVDGSGNVVVTGYSSGTNGYADYYTAKYGAADGALLWEKRYNGPVNSDDHAQAVAVDGSGNVVVTGVADAIPACNGCLWVGDYYTAKYAAADGALLWEQRYNGPGNYDDQARAVAVDSSGNVVVTGSSGNFPNSDYYTAKYAAANGALLWEQRYNGPSNGYDYATAVAVDGSGNVVVTGSSQGDYYTAKYAAADGALLWEKRYDDPLNSDDFASAVAVDGSGNVVVTGSSASGLDSIGYPIYDYYTAKYAAADGALLWEQRYNGPSNFYDLATAVAVDGSGNVVVTGISDREYEEYPRRWWGGDYYTAKYAAANGALLWDKRYNGPANSSDYAQAVAVDGSGNVVVTGCSQGDYYTAKYAAADGALLWEKRYNGGSAISLALGPNGMVAVTGSDGDYVTVVYREHLPPVSVALVPVGIRISFTGVPGHSYNIERAPSVTGPWSTLATPTAPVGGLIEYVDTNPPVGTAFYRTSAP